MGAAEGVAVGSGGWAQTSVAKPKNIIESSIRRMGAAFAAKLGIPLTGFSALDGSDILSNMKPLDATPRLTTRKFSPPRLPLAKSTEHVSDAPMDTATVSRAQDKKKTGLGLMGSLLTLGLATAALAGCTGSGAATPVAQQVTEPVIVQKMAANPFELMRMDDGSVAISADLQNDDAYVLAAGAAIRQDGGEEIALKTKEGTSLCEQAQALGGTCLNSEQVMVDDPSGPLLIETFAREGEPIHRIEAKHPDGSIGGVDLNKLPDGTEVFSDNGSGLLRHNGELKMYPGF